MEWLSQVGSALLERIPTSLGFRDVIDILLITIVVYNLLVLTQKTRATQVLKGIFLLFIAYQLVEIFQLKTISWLLQYVISAGAVIMVVMFQPEIRRALEQVGQGVSIERIPKKEMDKQAVIRGLVQAMTNMASRRVGALIVLRRGGDLSDIIETGVRIDALVSSRLLENIFEPKTPLHDGAVIVENDRVVAAACLLPMSDNKDLPEELGTRHRSAVGMSEHSDAVVLVVSEETGIMSYARSGEIVRPMTAEGLTELLNGLYGVGAPTGARSLKDKLKRRNKPAS